jgi:hypothetical protein
VYGIISSEDPLIFEVGGIGDATEVYTVGEGRLAVVTSLIARPNLGGLERAELIQHLSAHQRVLETVRQDFAVLPVKFGTILTDADQLRALLRYGASAFEQALEVYAGKQQLEVVVLWDLGQVFELIAADEAIVALKAQIAGKPAEECVAERVMVGQLVHKALQERREQLSRELVALVRPLADDLIINPLMGDAMAANVALLIADERRDELDACLDALDERYGGRLQIRCVGPLPPYSFATLEVRTPAFEAVDAARQALGLDEQTTYAALKRTYRALAAQHHPDHNQDDEGAAARMESLTGAYKLLASVARAQGAGAISDSWICRFDRAAVEETVLLAIVRQDVTQPEGGQSR